MTQPTTAPPVTYWKCLDSEGEPWTVVRGQYGGPSHYYSKTQKQWVEDAELTVDLVYGDDPGVGPPSDTKSITESEANALISGWQ